MKCKDCKSYQPPKERNSRYCPYYLNKGECRRCPPSIVIESHDVSCDFERYSTVVAKANTSWPKVYFDDWCGEYNYI